MTGPDAAIVAAYLIERAEAARRYRPINSDDEIVELAGTHYDEVMAGLKRIAEETDL